MTESITIRKALPSDAEALIAYMKRIGGESDNLSFGAEGLTDSVERERAFLEGLSANERSIMLVAVKNEAGKEEIAACANLSAMPRRLSHRAELGISVVKSEWGRGIGSAVIQTLIDHARAHGVEIINLEVRTDNARAIRLYERFGFTRIGVSPAFLKVNGEYHDALLMYLDLR